MWGDTRIPLLCFFLFEFALTIPGRKLNDLFVVWIPIISYNYLYTSYTNSNKIAYVSTQKKK